MSNVTPPTILLALHCLWMSCAFVAAAGPIQRWAQRPRVWQVVAVGNGGAMTLYLWHIPAIAVATFALHAVGLDAYDVACTGILGPPRATGRGVRGRHGGDVLCAVAARASPYSLVGRQSSGNRYSVDRSGRADLRRGSRHRHARQERFGGGCRLLDARMLPGGRRCRPCVRGWSQPRRRSVTDRKFVVPGTINRSRLRTNRRHTSMRRHSTKRNPASANNIGIVEDVDQYRLGSGRRQRRRRGTARL